MNKKFLALAAAAGAYFLFNTKKGNEVRNNLTKKASEVGGQLKTKYQDYKGQTQDKVDDAMA
jgi:uncharacterized membrane protein YebE (DUF533 family)